MTRLSLHIARPVIIWAIHFISVYALISAACAPRALLDADTTRAAIALISAGFAALLLVWVVTAGRLCGRFSRDDDEYALAQAAWWTALISLFAILANLWPIAVMSGCNG